MRPLRAALRSASAASDVRSGHPQRISGFARTSPPEMWAASERDLLKDPYTAWLAERDREQRPEIHWHNGACGPAGRTSAEREEPLAHV